MNYLMIHQLLVRSMALGAGIKAVDLRKEIQSFSDEDWYALSYVADQQLVLTAFWGPVKRAGLGSELPAELAQKLEEVYQLNRARNHRLLQEALELTRRLNARAITPVFMKGTANVLDGVYPDPAERFVGDIDFLVAESDIDATSEVMAEMGYTYDPAHETGKYHPDVKHLPRSFKEGNIFSVEAHIIPVVKEYTSMFNYEVIMKEAKLLERDGASFYVCSTRHKAMLNFIHDQLSNKGSYWGYVNLRGIYDALCLHRIIPLEDALLQSGNFIRKIENYLAAINCLAGKRLFAVRGGWRQRIFLWRVRKNVTSVFYYRANKWLLHLASRLLFYCFRFPLRFIRSATYRSYVRRRIQDHGWLSAHLNGLKPQG